MKFMAWVACVFVALVGLEISTGAPAGWRWVWIPSLAFCFLGGAGAVLFALVKILAARVGSGKQPITFPRAKDPGAAARPEGSK